MIPLSVQTAEARPFMLLCAPGFSPAFVGLKGPAASRDPHLRCAGFCSLTVPTAPEARRPQSHAPSSPSSVRGSWGRWHKSLNQSSPPQPPAPEGSRLLHPPPLPVEVKKCARTLYLYLEAIGLGVKGLLRPGEAASL